MENKQKLIEALIEKPSKYEVDVLDNSMLPKNLKRRKTITFIIKPPSIETLAKCMVPLLRIPEEYRNVSNPKEINLEEALSYRSEIAEILAIMAHGKNTDIPEWYVPFILLNLTPKELYNLFQESILKQQTDFFLTSFQIASQSNPMMMTKKKDLIPTHS